MLTSADIAQRFHAARSIAIECGERALTFFEDHSSLGVSMKGYQDWLTVADGAVETLFRERIAQAFPDDAVMGEEQGGAASDRLWIIDPIDGTANFARGDRMWCVSIGFLAAGVPEIGVILAPALDETFLGRRGHGATMNGKPLAVASTDDMRRASIEFGWSPRRPSEDYLAAVARLYASGASVKRSASGALGLAHVAIGRTDAYAELHINAWDVAGGIVIASEAGAWVNDFFAGDWVRDGNPILAAAPGVAEAVRSATGIA